MESTSISQIRGAKAEEVGVKESVCYALFAFDCAQAVDLVRAEQLLESRASKVSLGHKRRLPKYVEIVPSPLNFSMNCKSVPLKEFASATVASCVLYEFGGLSVKFSIDFKGSFEKLVRLSEDLYDNPTLEKVARDIVNDVTRTLATAMIKPGESPEVESYSVFHIKKFDRDVEMLQVCDLNSSQIARVLRSDGESLDLDEVNDALKGHLTYSSKSRVYVDWSASIIFSEQDEDLMHVLEFANVSLLELRFLDSQLDASLDTAYTLLGRRSTPFFGAISKKLNRIGRLQVDGAVLFENITNGLKLFSDQFLGRVYRMALNRMNLDTWNSNILRKLNVLNSVYEKYEERQARQRLEFLEWLIIILIAVSIMMPVLPK